MYHIGLNNNLGACYAILTGDPGRVESIAALLENPQYVCSNREYTTWRGEISGETVLAISTGMGGPSTAICIEELYKLGIKNYIRVGTCGGMAAKVVGGDVVIATGAIRAEGTSREYVPIEFPAVADIDVTNALVAAASALGANRHTGIVHCKDSFYGQHEPERMPNGERLLQSWRAWIKAGCLASEMESASLFIVSQILGARAGCVLNVVWNQERERQGLSNPKTVDTTIGIKIAIEAIKILLQADKAQN